MNSKGMPVYSLLVSTLAMQIIVFVVAQAESVYLTAIDIASTMVLPAYLFSALFLLKATSNPQKFLGPSYANRLWGMRTLAILCAGYCLWMIYAAGLRMLMYASVFYVFGIVLFVIARRKNYPRQRVFTAAERAVAAALVLCALGVSYAFFR